MKKLKLDLDEISVETFSTTRAPEERGTAAGHQDTQTCNFDAGCYHTGGIDNMCSANCTGIGVECYTADPQYYACTGGDNCTDANACTYTGCTVDNVTCVNC
jgi:hypothetical protein